MTYSNAQTVKKEVDAQLRAMRVQGKKVAATKKTALAFLIRAGICSKKGQLSSRYK